MTEPLNLSTPAQLISDLGWQVLSGIGHFHPKCKRRKKSELDFTFKQKDLIEQAIKVLMYMAELLEQ